MHTCLKYQPNQTAAAHSSSSFICGTHLCSVNLATSTWQLLCDTATLLHLPPCNPATLLQPVPAEKQCGSGHGWGWSCRCSSVTRPRKVSAGGGVSGCVLGAAAAAALPGQPCCRESLLGSSTAAAANNLNDPVGLNVTVPTRQLCHCGDGLCVSGLRQNISCCPTVTK